MYIAFYTYDLFPGREKLMPWRTILEVAKWANENGYPSFILNACSDVVNSGYVYKGVKIVNLHVGYNNLLEYYKNKPFDVIYIPFVWRNGLKHLDQLGELTCKKIAYFPGGVYDFTSVFRLFLSHQYSLAKSFLLECSVPKSLLAKQMKKNGFSSAIALTELTKLKSVESGFNNTVTIFPGKDEITDFDSSILDRYKLLNKKFLLFTGSPTPMRGGDFLLESIDKCSDDSLRVVFLLRNDIGSDSSRFNDIYAKMKNPHRVKIIREQVTKAQLNAFFKQAYYVILPFLVIPSELPLTYLEVLALGTPIITFYNGGTTEYLQKALYVVKKNRSSLSCALREAWKNDSAHREYVKQAHILMDLHPNWNETCERWIKLLK